MRCAAVLLAGGSGSRVGSQRNKVLLELGGEPVVVHSLRTVLALEEVVCIVLVTRPEDRDDLTAAITAVLGDREVILVDGGSTRHGSEENALAALAGVALDVIAIHDTARPLASAALWRRTLAAADRRGGAVPLVGVDALIRRDGSLLSTSVGAVQTPQAFRAEPLRGAYRDAAEDGFTGSDTAACVEAYRPEVEIAAVAGEVTNVKVTYATDLPLAQALLG